MAKKNRKNEQIIIIGAGPCGLGAGWRLSELGYKNFQIFEKESFVGGLAASITDSKGFIWDLGGHVLHSHYDYFDKMFESVTQNAYLVRQRSAWVWLFDRFIPYPLQNNLAFLPQEIQQECLQALLKPKKNSKKPNNFAQWLEMTFGKGLCDHFLFPYNRKVWGFPLEQLNFTWVGDRVAPLQRTALERQIKIKYKKSTWGPNNIFKYPIAGNGDLWNQVAHNFSDRITLTKRVVRIEAEAQKIWFADGENIAYDRLVSTMPLDILLSLISDVSFPSSEDFLFHSSVALVGIGVKGTLPESLTSKNWIYFSSSDIPFFRASVLSNYSPQLAPKGTWSLLCEVTYSSFRPLTEKQLAKSVIKALKKTQLLPQKSQIVSIWEHHLPYGYPTPTLKRDLFINTALKQLEKYHIYPRGRFGAWKYEVSNQDHTFMQGVEWVNAHLLGIKETTLFAPNLVNKKA